MEKVYLNETVNGKYFFVTIQSQSVSADFFLSIIKRHKEDPELIEAVHQRLIDYSRILEYLKATKDKITFTWKATGNKTEITFKRVRTPKKAKQ